ncbi:hypothetical protein SAMN05444921_107198 [Streptomyces wuyuanensis]|uniref:Uncharacterized protein n=1 Tax=Streptomyces wuyuanensis TaxID=1196353 RepID=A0A1G9SSF2_9ACTN|nr:hypothetical protein SAMN05444921_107198 [Streptomyces wuyuanensis]
MPDARRPGVLAAPRAAALPARTGASAPGRRRSRRPGRPRPRRRRRRMCRMPQGRPGRRRSRKLPIEPLRPRRRPPGRARRRSPASRGRRRRIGGRSPCARPSGGSFRVPRGRPERGRPPGVRPPSAAPSGVPVREPGRGRVRRCGRPGMRARKLLVAGVRGRCGGGAAGMRRCAPDVAGPSRRWATRGQRGRVPSGHCRVFFLWRLFGDRRPSADSAPPLRPRVGGGAAGVPGGSLYGAGAIAIRSVLVHAPWDACSLARREQDSRALGRRGVAPYPWGYGVGKMIPGQSSAANRRPPMRI